MTDSDSELETRLTRWGDAQRSAAELDAPEQVPIRELLHQRRGRRAVWPVLAAIAATVLLAIAIGAIALGRTGNQAATSIPCNQQFRGPQRIDARAYPSTITIRLAYLGGRRCTISGSGPELRLTNFAGRTIGPLDLHRNAARNLTVSPGDIVTFRIGGFLMCVATPRDTYTLAVFLRPVRHPSRARGVAIPVLTTAGPTPYCQPRALGVVSSPTVLRDHGPEPPTRSHPPTNVPQAFHLPGYVAVGNAGNDQGQARKSDLDEVQLVPASPAQALRWQHNRRGFAAVVPMYARDGRTVISQWTGLGAARERPVAITCAHRDGVGVSFIPPRDDHGARTPIGAARTVRQHLGIGHFGNARTSWQISEQTATTATITSGRITVSAITLPNGTWVINHAQRCNS